jgi:hypothetical protein
MLAVAGGIILAVLLWLVYAAFAIALVVGDLLAVAFLGPWATVGIVAILIGGVAKGIKALQHSLHLDCRPDSVAPRRWNALLIYVWVRSIAGVLLLM